jgi:hypothetical protein
MKTPKYTPTPEQLEALRAFAAKHGAGWKVILHGKWMNGGDVNEPNGHLLRQVRNQGGPRWLTKFGFPLPPLTAADIEARHNSIPRAR